jgi:hypothetical protein
VDSGIIEAGSPYLDIGWANYYDCYYVEVDIPEPEPSPLVFNINGPFEVYASTFVEWDANIISGTPPYEYSWQMRTHSTNGTWGNWTQVGDYESLRQFIPSSIDEMELKLTISDRYNPPSHYGEYITVKHKLLE